jgi:hypothetical protein
LARSAAWQTVVERAVAQYARWWPGIVLSTNAPLGCWASAAARTDTASMHESA